jgi:Magnesium chelatase, subunit ChlI
MLARRLTTILPAMTLAEAIETTRIHSVAGRTGDRTALVTTRPFRAPHHTISDVGLIGGGHVPNPGGVSLAHRGSASWMHGRGAAATSWGSGGNRSRRHHTDTISRASWIFILLQV